MPIFVECMPCDYRHGTCMSDGTCKCNKGYTALDCSLECSPCVHGDCRMDGSCHCRPGWTLLDCSKKVWDGGGAVRSDFSESSEGWRVYNNSCPGLLEVGGVGRRSRVLPRVLPRVRARRTRDLNALEVWTSGCVISFAPAMRPAMRQQTSEREVTPVLLTLIRFVHACVCGWRYGDHEP